MTNRMRKGNLALKLARSCLVQLNWLFICTYLLCGLFPAAQAEYLNHTDYHPSVRVSYLDSGKFRQFDFTGNRDQWGPLTEHASTRHHETNPPTIRSDRRESWRALEGDSPQRRLAERVTPSGRRDVSGDTSTERRFVRDSNLIRDANSRSNFRTDRQSARAVRLEEQRQKVNTRARINQGRLLQEQIRSDERIQDGNRRRTSSQRAAVENRRRVQSDSPAPRISSTERFVDRREPSRNTESFNRLRQFRERAFSESRQPSSFRNRADGILHEARIATRQNLVAARLVESSIRSDERRVSTVVSRERASSDRSERRALDREARRISHRRESAFFDRATSQRMDSRGEVSNLREGARVNERERRFVEREIEKREVSVRRERNLNDRTDRRRFDERRESSVRREIHERISTDRSTRGELDERRDLSTREMSRSARGWIDNRGESSARRGKISTHRSTRVGIDRQIESSSREMSRSAKRELDARRELSTREIPSSARRELDNRRELSARRERISTDRSTQREINDRQESSIRRERLSTDRSTRVEHNRHRRSSNREISRSTRRKVDERREYSGRQSRETDRLMRREARNHRDAPVLREACLSDQSDRAGFDQRQENTAHHGRILTDRSNLKEFARQISDDTDNASTRKWRSLSSNDIRRTVLADDNLRQDRAVDRRHVTRDGQSRVQRLGSRRENFKENEGPTRAIRVTNSGRRDDFEEETTRQSFGKVFVDRMTDSRLSDRRVAERRDVRDVVDSVKLANRRVDIRDDVNSRREMLSSKFAPSRRILDDQLSQTNTRRDSRMNGGYASRIIEKRELREARISVRRESDTPNRANDWESRRSEEIPYKNTIRQFERRELSREGMSFDKVTRNPSPSRETFRADRTDSEILARRESVMERRESNMRIAERRRSLDDSALAREGRTSLRRLNERSASERRDSVMKIRATMTTSGRQNFRTRRVSSVIVESERSMDTRRRMHVLRLGSSMSFGRRMVARDTTDRIRRIEPSERREIVREASERLRRSDPSERREIAREASERLRRSEPSERREIARGAPERLRRSELSERREIARGAPERLRRSELSERREIAREASQRLRRSEPSERREIARESSRRGRESEPSERREIVRESSARMRRSEPSYRGEVIRDGAVRRSEPSERRELAREAVERVQRVDSSRRREIAREASEKMRRSKPSERREIARESSENARGNDLTQRRKVARKASESMRRSESSERRGMSRASEKLRRNESYQRREVAHEAPGSSLGHQRLRVIRSEHLVRLTSRITMSPNRERMSGSERNRSQRREVSRANERLETARGSAVTLIRNRDARSTKVTPIRESQTSRDFTPTKRTEINSKLAQLPYRLSMSRREKAFSEKSKDEASRRSSFVLDSGRVSRQYLAPVNTEKYLTESAAREEVASRRDRGNREKRAQLPVREDLRRGPGLPASRNSDVASYDSRVRRQEGRDFSGVSLSGRRLSQRFENLFVKESKHDLMSGIMTSIGGTVSFGVELAASPVKMLSKSLGLYVADNSAHLVSCVSWLVTLALVAVTILDQKTLANIGSNLQNHLRFGMFAGIRQFAACFPGNGSGWSQA
nr:PREDICTED: trichohyalin-like [Bemisia tabaci]